MADMDILTSTPFKEEYWSRVLGESRPKCLVVDANWTPATIRSLISMRGKAQAIFEPVSVAKSVRLFEGKTLGVYPAHQVDLATPNIFELLAMYDAAKDKSYFDENSKWTEVIDQFNLGGSNANYKEVFEDLMKHTSKDMKAAGVPQKLLHLLPYIPKLVVKLGEYGCLMAEIMLPDDPRLAVPKKPDHISYFVNQQQSILTRAAPDSQNHKVGGVYMRHYWPQEKVDDVVSVNGVGDTFLGVLTAGLARGGTLHKLIGFAQNAAIMTLRSKEAVSPQLEELSRKIRVDDFGSWWQRNASEKQSRAVELGDRPVQGGGDPTFAKRLKGKIEYLVGDGRLTLAQAETVKDAVVRGMSLTDALTHFARDPSNHDGHAVVRDVPLADTVLEGGEAGKVEQTMQDDAAAEEETGKYTAGTPDLSTWSKLSADSKTSKPRDIDAQETPVEETDLKTRSAVTDDDLTTSNTVTDDEQPKQMPVAKRIHQALTDTGLTKEQADQTIKDFLASESLWELAKWKVEYKRELAAKEAAAKAAAKAAAVARDDAEGIGGWGAFARKGLQDTMLQDWEIAKLVTPSEVDRTAGVVAEEAQPEKSDAQLEKDDAQPEKGDAQPKNFGWGSFFKK